MNILKCHHHGFTVSDLDKSLAFYRDALGLEVLRVSERSNLPSYDRMLGYPDVKLRVALLRHVGTDFLLELFQYVNPPVEKRRLEPRLVGAAHVALEVDDVDAVYERLRSHGYSAINPPVDVVRDGRKVARGMYALDGDGIFVEIFQEYADVVKH